MPDMGRERHREDIVWPVVLSAVLLSGAVAAAVSAATVRLAVPEAPAIASVRLGEIAAAYAVEAAGTESRAEDAAAEARRWAAALETALARVAEREGVVLLPARAGRRRGARHDRPGRGGAGGGAGRVRTGRGRPALGV